MYTWRVRWGASAVAFGVVVTASQVCLAGAPKPTYARTVDGDGVVHFSPTSRVAGQEQVPSDALGRGSEAFETHPADVAATILEDVADRSRYDRWIRDAAQHYQLPETLIRAVIHTESRYNPRAVSRTGAMGLMQLMPATARFLGVSDGFDPRQNIYGGSKYLRLLANMFNGDMVLVLAGYFSGAGAVRKYGGVPPHPGVRRYVKAVLRRYYAYERESQRIYTSAPKPSREIADPQ